MNFISTFAGIGGFDLALERAGMTCIAQVEIDDRCNEVLEHHWPKVRRFTDVRTFGRKSIRGTVDLVCGGFPCQDLSVAGKRAGLAGERSGLYYDFARIAHEFGAEWVVGENVPGLLSSNGGLDFAIVLGGLTGIVPSVPDTGWGNAGLAWGSRYKVAWRVLDAQYFGVAQRRRRVFIVGSLTTGRAAQVLFESAGLFGDPPTRRKAGQGTSTDVAPSIRGSGVGTHRIGEQTGQDPVIAVTGTLDSKSAAASYGAQGNEADFLVPVTFDWQSGGDVRHNVSEKPNLQANQVPAVFGGGNTSGEIDVATARNVKGDTRLDFDTETFVAYDARGNGEGDIAPNITRDHPGRVTDYTPIVVDTANSNSHSKNAKESDVVGSLDQSNSLAIANWQSGGGKMDDDKAAALRSGAEASYQFAYGIYDEQTPKVGDGVMPTMRGRETAGGFQQSVGSNFGVRRLTPTECARLQGFPDDWNDWLPDSVRYRQFGNAVAVPNVEWIARRIAALHNT